MRRLTPEERQGAAIAFDTFTPEILQDIALCALGLPLPPIGPEYRHQQMVRDALENAKRTLVRRALLTARIEDRNEVEALRWLSRRGLYFFDELLYKIKDPKKRRRPRLARKTTPR